MAFSDLRHGTLRNSVLVQRLTPESLNPSLEHWAVAVNEKHDNPDPSPTSHLSHQYGGYHTGSWADRLPPSWVPNIQLSRLSPPAGVFLIHFPHLFGVLHAIATASISLGWPSIKAMAIVSLHTRPIPRGAITRMGALLFACSQAVCAATFLVPLSRGLKWVAVCISTLPTIVGTLYYPLAKRQTHFAQFVLGFCLSWGMMLRSAATNSALVASLRVSPEQAISKVLIKDPWTDPSTLALLIASIAWVVIFDTIYAHQDLADDVHVGVKSTAVLLSGNNQKSRATTAPPIDTTKARIFLVIMYLVMLLALVTCGHCSQLGPAYYLFTVGTGCGLSVGAMVVKVDLTDPANCWKWFSKGFWMTGLAIVGGFTLEWLTGRAAT
ncbi:hypothetical protein QBC37DRAFT_455304 [Rhypophila decipiens]|uniref:Uncharacterized protein n=1 Tax=Rhypophila decipiens TaxID=261697 RepID=A0AAN6XVC6_9PEZI|nr:hypothetical protein QBC37DRAFT_455304 [Rhypophila decipiens]